MLKALRDQMSARGIIVSYEAIRYWCLKFDPVYARSLRRKQSRLENIWHVDELFVTIRGQRHYLWRAVDQDKDVIDILVTKHRDRRAAKRFSAGCRNIRKNLPDNSSLTSFEAIQQLIVRSFLP